MPKIKPEKIAGIVALTYLVLIPGAGYLGWKKILKVEKDIDEAWIRIQNADPSGKWAYPREDR